MKYFILVLFCFCLLACKAKPQPQGYAPGACVEMKLDGRRGMATNSFGHGVWVRFAAPSEHTNTHILSTDGDVERAPYALVLVSDFELRPCSK